MMKLATVWMAGLLALSAAEAQTQTPLQSLKPGAPLPAGAATSGIVVLTGGGFFVGTLQQVAAWLAPLLPAPALNRQSLTLTSWNGTTASFTIPATPIAGTLDVYKNGLLMSLTVDYSVNSSAGSTTVTFVAANIPQAPQAGQPPDVVTARWFQ